MKESVLVLSTAHMPNTDPEFGGLRAIPFECGFIVWVAEPGYGVPWWITSVMEHAWNEGCTLIMFDRDVEVYKRFPSWDW